MYLAKFQISSNTHYEIRKSFQHEDGSYGYKTIFNLGENPASYFELYEDHIVLFDNNLLKAVTKGIAKDGESTLELLLFDFLPPACKDRIQLFQGRSHIHRGPLTSDEKSRIAEEIHLFDRRRLYYLRYGAVDQSRLSRLHEKCCRPLLGQSRDEKEYFFAAEEQVLEPGMYLQYIFAIFNLQKYFTQSFAPWLPEALAIESMGEYLEEAICLLQKDSRFWQGHPEDDFLHPHLARYLIMFFDFAPAPRSFFDDFARSFMAGRRSFKWPERSNKIDSDKAMEIFGQSLNQLKKLSKSELTKLYRSKAMELHPDKGGDHERFVDLSTIYTTLLKS